MENVNEHDGKTASVRVFLDDGALPVATYRPPATFHLDTSALDDGEHELRIEASDTLGTVGVRRIPFVVANGPGITVTGLRAGARIRGAVDININAFGANEPFDPVRAESPGPIPVWTWVMIAIIAAWAGWYGLEYFATPPAFAQTPTYSSNPALAAAQLPATETNAAPVAIAGKNAAGFDYATLGPQEYAQNCAACHGANGAGVAGAFPSLAGDPVVNGRDAGAHIRIVLKGLAGKTIGGVHFASQMPAFAAQLTDAQIAAVIDHERTSWGNHGPVITPNQVKRDR